MDALLLGVAKASGKHPKYPAGSPGGKGGQFMPKGSGYTMDAKGAWKDAKGRAPSKEHQERLKTLGVARGYKDVRLSADPTHYMQAQVTDIKGRTKRLYTSEFNNKQKALKFKRLRDFHKERPGILAASRAAFADPKHPDHDSAVVLRLIDETGFRSGSLRETGAAQQAFGATTLLGKHVRIRGTKAIFSFTGKNGKLIAHELEHPELARNLALRKKRYGDRGRLFPDTSAERLRTYLTEASGGRPFLVKDFRTWRATAMAKSALAGMEAPESKSAFRKLQRRVATHVAHHLGNTPAMALHSYIDPTVWHSVGGHRWE